uniref:Rab-GAP TBC domain-containing protein n=1 Tax=Strombidium rassoulzadegani TaxID=1082188 RepID=A0A7S3FVU5_9SPIT|mmetsp:Transcript_12656/g.21299  ORF Transcript_12656/g.21299 Transcript_12656/m.21299 type:complete len:284 (+) Transcript_12656:246-1097(+)
MIKKDLARTDLGNEDFKVDYKSGRNTLYNVLFAYSTFDPPVGYCQGMNMIVSWLLKFLREYREQSPEESLSQQDTPPNKSTQEVSPATLTPPKQHLGLDKVLEGPESPSAEEGKGRIRLVYNEVDCFFCMIRIMQDLKWRRVFEEGMPGLISHLELITEILSTSYPKIYNHLVYEQNEIDLVPYFAGMIMSVFVSDLHSISPQIAVHIFDVFLVDGESVIFTLLIKFISLMEETILDFEDQDDLLDYMRKEMPKDCLKNFPMHQLLDFEATVEVERRQKYRFT